LTQPGGTEKTAGFEPEAGTTGGYRLETPIWRPVDKLFVYYLIGMALLIFLLRDNVPEWKTYFLSYLVGVALVAGLRPHSGHNSPMVIRLLAEGYPVIGYVILYKVMGGLIHIIFPGWFDPLVISIDQAIFRTQPSLWFLAHQNPVVTEILYFCYLSFYWLLPLIALIYFIKGEYQRFAVGLHAVGMAFFVSFTIFFLFPVEGPRFALKQVGLETIDGGLFFNIVNRIIKLHALHGGCMPSTHTAASVAVLLFIYSHRPRWGLILTPVVIGLIVATVYSQFHYATDSLVGLLIGVVSIVIAGGWNKRWTRRLQDGTYKSRLRRLLSRIRKHGEPDRPQGNV